MADWKDDVERDEMTSAARRYSERALLERDSQRFDFQVEGEAHSIVIRRGSFDFVGPKIAVDGEAAGRIVLPNARRTFTERDFEIAGHEVVTTLADNEAGRNPIADVFVDGSSLVDGRSIDDARAEAPGAKLLADRFIGSLHFGMPRDLDGAGEGCIWVVVVGFLLIVGIALLLLVIDVILVVVGAVMAFWAANSIPGRRSVVDAIRWRLLAIETAAIVALILGTAWVLRH